MSHAAYDGSMKRTIGIDVVQKIFAKEALKHKNDRQFGIALGVDPRYIRAARLDGYYAPSLLAALGLERVKEQRFRRVK